MRAFSLLAMSILKELRMPLVVTNKRFEVIAANDSGWSFLGDELQHLRGSRLEQMIRPIATGPHTPLSPPTSYDPSHGWEGFTESGTHVYPRVRVAAVNGQGERVMRLEVNTISGDEVLDLARLIYEKYPEWVAEPFPIEVLTRMITPENYMLCFSDVTEEADAEEHHRAIMRETLDVVVRTLNHYIRNALTPILGYSEMIRDMGEALPKEMLVEITEKMIDNVQIITSVLDALRGIRDVQFVEPLGADATLIRIEEGLKQRLGEPDKGDVGI